MACYGMVNGQKVKVTKIKDMTVPFIDKIRANIMKGLPATVDQTGSGPGHKHVFKWQDVSVAVEAVEYQRVTISLYNTR